MGESADNNVPEQEPEVPTSLTPNELECLGQLRGAFGRVGYKGEYFQVELEYDGNNFRFVGRSSARMVSFDYDVAAAVFTKLDGADVQWIKAFVKGNQILED